MHHTFHGDRLVSLDNVSCGIMVTQCEGLLNHHSLIPGLNVMKLMWKQHAPHALFYPLLRLGFTVMTRKFIKLTCRHQEFLLNQTIKISQVEVL